MKKPFDVKSWTCLSFELAVVLQGLCPKLTSGAIPKREQVLNRCVLNKELLPGTPQKDLRQPHIPQGFTHRRCSIKILWRNESMNECKSYFSRVALSDNIYWALTLCQWFFQVLIHPLAHLILTPKRGHCSMGGLLLSAPGYTGSKGWAGKGSWQAASGISLLTTLPWAYSLKWLLPPSLFSCCAFHPGCPPSCPFTELHPSIPPKPASSPMDHMKPFLGTPASDSLLDLDCRSAHYGSASQLEGKDYPE